MAICRDLQEAFNSFNTKHTFHVGQQVEYKPNMQHKQGTGPFIVMEILETPIVDHESSGGSPYFREPLDIILGEFGPKGEFLLFHYDSRRFQPI